MRVRDGFEARGAAGGPANGKKGMNGEAKRRFDAIQIWSRGADT